MNMFVGGDLKGAPAPGSTHPGDLYVDLESRTLWLGVEAAVDPTESVLISDYLGLAQDIVEAEARAKAYTDEQVALRAPISHTHTSSQITDFTAAVQAVAGAMPQLNFTKGMIMLYTGSLAEIGVGPLAGWALCNGSNGTPDLRDKFILGAGNKAIGVVNPNANFNVGNGGAHTHSIDYHVLTINEMPAHNHGSVTGYISHNHQHYFSANTGYESADHTHTYNRPSLSQLVTGGVGTRAGALEAATTAGRSAAHYHAVAEWTGTVSENHYHAIPSQGANYGHNHVAANAPDHTHNVTSAQLRDALPYYALAYIMKL